MSSKTLNYGDKYKEIQHTHTHIYKFFMFLIYVKGTIIISRHERQNVTTPLLTAYR
jgi:hypothetical protein